MRYSKLTTENVGLLTTYFQLGVFHLLRVIRGSITQPAAILNFSKIEHYSRL